MKVSSVVMDLDGCVYKGSKLIEGSREAIDILRNIGVKVKFITNNATKTREEYKEKLVKFGINVSEDDILTSGYVTSIYLRKTYGKSKVYPIGTTALSNELLKEGHEIVEWNNAEFVVVALDFNFNYRKLSNAVNAILKGAKLIATNMDPLLPTEEGFLPGAGSIVSAIEYATGRKAFLIGKPSKVILEVASSIWKLGDDTVIVGDQIGTDIKSGNEIGWYTVLVLSGCTKAEDLKEIDEKMKPKLVLNNIFELAKKWNVLFT